MRGRFITLEGGEGAGKSTQIRLLAEALREKGIEAVTTREPGGSPGAEEIRSLLVSGEPGRWTGMTEALLHFAARCDHLERTVRPALKAKKWVISDRYADSTLAYQGYGHGVPCEDIRRLYRLVIGDFAPHLTLILDLPVEEGLERAKSRGGDDRYERMGLEFHRRLRQGFLDIAHREPGRCAVIDAARSQQEVAGEILFLVERRLLS
jgi:dTMP kinase